MVTLMPPTSEARVRFPVWPKWIGLPLVGSLKYRTLTNYVLVSSALPTTRRDMTCTVLKAT